MELNVLKTTIQVGLANPVKLLHITDTHIVRDGEKENGRAAVFGTTDEQIEQHFLNSLEYAKNNNLFIVHTGDLIDYITKENLEFLKENFSDVDYIYAPGSHDFVHFIPGSPEHCAWRDAGNTEDDAYKVNQIKLVAPYIKNNMYFSSRIVDGLNIVTIDDSYLHITKGQLDALKAEVSKGYPIVVAMHVPIHTKGFQELAVPPRENLCSTVAEQKEHAIKNNRPEWAENIREYDEDTWCAVDYIKSEPLIKAVFVGHRHRDLVEKIGDQKYQIVTPAGCSGFAREITFI